MILRFINPSVFLEAQQHSGKSRTSFYFKRGYLGIIEIDWSLTGIILINLTTTAITTLISVAPQGMAIDAEYGSSRACSRSTAAADFLTAVEPCLYSSILLSSVPCSSEKQPLPYPNLTYLSKDLLLRDSAAHNTRCRTRDDIKDLLSYLCLLKVCKVTMMKLINWRQLVQVSEQGTKLYKIKQINYGCGCIFFYLVMISSIDSYIWHDGKNSV